VEVTRVPLISVITPAYDPVPEYLEAARRSVLDQELREPRVYFSVLQELAHGDKESNELVQAIRLDAQRVSKYLKVLESMRVVERRLGHALASHAEAAKIEVAAGGETTIGMEEVEEALRIGFDEQQLIDAGLEETRRIVAAARETVHRAGVTPQDVDAIYFTGGSTGLGFLSKSLSNEFPEAEAVFGDRLASVATGLGIYARRLFA